MWGGMQVKRIFRGIFQKEVFAYCLWGTTTTVVSVVAYMGLSSVVDYRLANLAAILMGKVYAYVVNKWFVFKSVCGNWKLLLREMGAYLLARGLTGIIDFVGVVILVEWMYIGKNTAKLLTTTTVIAVNYFLGKKVVFVSKGRGWEDGVSFRKL